ncbi:sigma factor [Sutcliffiella rhizosphaerae]|uniref:sigma factor n=1 Tax=Sutcliffiella rhizosphaerae TaxID=2880967 RepID=UPI00295F359A|nr:sigma factor [Sutcliffiella rhizosphaerae]
MKQFEAPSRQTTDTKREGDNVNEGEKNHLLEKVMLEFGDQHARLAYSYVKDKETAKYIVQNVFVKCYTKLNEFRHESSLKTWLYRITINECKDYLKSWNYRKTRLLDLYQSRKIYIINGRSCKREVG